MDPKNYCKQVYSTTPSIRYVKNKTTLQRDLQKTINRYKLCIDNYIAKLEWYTKPLYKDTQKGKEQKGYIKQDNNI